MSDDGIYLSSTNGHMWDLFKQIIDSDDLNEINRIAERGIAFLKEEAT